MAQYRVGRHKRLRFGFVRNVDCALLDWVVCRIQSLLFPGMEVVGDFSEVRVLIGGKMKMLTVRKKAAVGLFYNPRTGREDDGASLALHGDLAD